MRFCSNHSLVRGPRDLALGTGSMRLRCKTPLGARQRWMLPSNRGMSWLAIIDGRVRQWIDVYEFAASGRIGVRVENSGWTLGNSTWDNGDGERWVMLASA